MKKILIILCINFVFGVNFDELREMYLKDSKYWSKALVDDGIEYEEIGALPSMPPYPYYNPYSESKVELGKKLFNDPKLSSSNQIACASCHDREFGFGDGRKLSYGHNRALGKRNSPSVAMSAFGIEKFWDGRAKNLEEQALMPILDEREMAFDPDSAAKKLNNIEEYNDFLNTIIYEIFTIITKNNLDTDILESIFYFIKYINNRSKFKINYKQNINKEVFECENFEDFLYLCNRYEAI